MMTAPAARFREEYAAHRASEGRAYQGASLLALPYLTDGPHAGQWAVRARTFDAFVRKVLEPMARGLSRPLDIADLGAGNGWLSYRCTLAGHRPVAVDVRDDDVDGLGAAAGYFDGVLTPFERIAASFEDLPLASRSVDIAVFNASLHYAIDLAQAVREAVRVVRRHGRIVILDSPFYSREADGAAMVAEKLAGKSATFGSRADALTALPFIEFLTRQRLATASARSSLEWRRHRVRYPWRYELRPLLAMLRRARVPSRFDLWECTVP